jgi:hypothetical protein
MDLHSIKYERVVALLVECIKEMSIKIKNLEENNGT